MNIKHYLTILLFLWATPSLACGDESLFILKQYLVIAIVPIPFFIIAYALRKKRKPTNWLVLILITPMILSGLLFSVEAVYSSIYRDDYYDNIVAGIVGATYLIVTVMLFLSSKNYHKQKI